jgi:hypothetical protein
VIGRVVRGKNLKLKITGIHGLFIDKKASSPPYCFHTMTKQAGKETVQKLIDNFEKNESQFMSKSFQESEARNRFIDPFFVALSWELNQTCLQKKFWDVHREFSQRDNSATKKPDYAFRVKEGAKYREKFFVEAKALRFFLTWENADCHPDRFSDIQGF